MSQTIFYNAFSDVFVLYRGGYDHDKPYKKGNCPYNRQEIKDGFILLVHDDMKEKLHKMLHVIKDGKNHKYSVNFSMCFTSNCRVVLYDNTTSVNKGRKSKICNKRTPLLKTWGNQFHYYDKKDFPATIDYWDIKGDYIICNICQFRDLNNIIPEYIKDNPERSKLLDYSLVLDDYNEKKLYNKKCEMLYAIDPIDLNNSWDYTEEIKQQMKEEEKRKKEFERDQYLKLVERRNTPGYCSICGCDHAEYIVDQCVYEMEGYKTYKWLCPQCAEDLAMCI